MLKKSIGTILVLSLLIPLTGTASAYRRSHSPLCTPWTDVNWRFGNTNGTTSTDLAAFRDGANNWNTLRGANNNQFLFSDEVSSGANVVVNWDEDVTASTNCSSTTIRYITMDYDEPLSINTYAAAHEIGHTFGMRHTGRTDNLSPDGAPTFPLMGCGPQPASPPQVPLADDVAQAFARVGPRATPNWGFENGSSWWTLGGGASLVSTTVYGGTKAVNLPPGGWIRARIRKAEPGNHRMVARWRPAATDPSDHVTFQVSAVSVDYTNYPFGADACPHINTFTEGATVTYPIDEDEPVNFAGTYKSFVSPSFTVTGGSEGFRASIWVINNSDVNVRVDNVALEQT
jgi:hypothetical protein